MLRRVARAAARTRGSRAALVVLVALLLALVASAGEEIRGKVVKIRDGDTIEVLRGTRTVRIRVHGVDTPERGQPWSARAKSFTADLAGSRDVVVVVRDVDRYRRVVGEVLLPDGRSLAYELVRAGLAWHYKRYSSDPELARLEAEARRARRGLWIDPKPTPPWEHRARRRPR